MRMKMVKQPRGYVFYRGPSAFDGQTVVGIVVLESENGKTGNMAQTYILRDNGQTPYDNAMKTFEDASVCGDCQHRRGAGTVKDCYVELLRGPHMVWKQYREGKYPEDLNLEIVPKKLAGRPVRLGAYGDPFAIPSTYWKQLLARAKGWTGYTQVWRHEKFTENEGIMQWCMASCDSEESWMEAVDLGYRPYRIRKSEDEPLMAHEFACPSSAEEGYRRTCETCLACNGGVDSRKATPAIVVHGTLAKRMLAMAA